MDCEDIKDFLERVGEDEVFEGQISHHFDLGRRGRRMRRRGEARRKEGQKPKSLKTERRK